MERNLSEVIDAISRDAIIIRDCQFEELYLVGKPFPDNRKTISFLGASKYIQDFLNYDIKGVLCSEEIAGELKKVYQGGIAIVSEPKTVFFEIHNYLASTQEHAETNQIAQSAKIHPSVIIEDNDVVIGENTEIMAHTVIKAGSRIGSDCVIREGCIIGAPAFYYYGSGDDRKLVISSGTVVVGNNVELHTNVVVEKGVLGGSTAIGNNTKIDNNCLVGHDSQIGQDVTMAGASTIAGGVELGDGCFLGVGVSVSPYVRCGNRSKISSGAVVTKDVPDDTQASGNFAILHEKFIQHIKSISKE